MALTDLSLAPAGGFVQPKRFSLADSIADSIAEAIATRRLQAGERIVELTLADRLGVSRVPIREALKVLHAQGILTGGANRGYRVAAFDAQTVTKVFEIRLMLETMLLRDALENWRAGRADLAALDAALHQMEMAAKTRDGLHSLNADLDFHRAICESAHNEIAATLWNAIARHVLIIFSHDDYRDSDLAAVAAHHKAFRAFIAEAIAKPRTEAELKAALEAHLTQVAHVKRRRSA